MNMFLPTAKSCAGRVPLNRFLIIAKRCGGRVTMIIFLLKPRRWETMSNEQVLP